MQFPRDSVFSSLPFLLPRDCLFISLRILCPLKAKMGRKPKSQKKNESTNLSIEGMKMEPASKNPSLTSGDEKPESTNPALDKLGQQEGKMSSHKKLKNTPAKVRRSGRLQSAMTPTDNQCIERIIEEITVSGSDKEEPADEFPEPTMNKTYLDEKVDYLVQLVEAQQKAMDGLSSKLTGKTFVSEGSAIGDITYKSLYFDSQKKVEALLEENKQLNKKLDYYRGKIDVYEKGNHVTSEMLDKLKDVFFPYPSLAKATEAMVHASSKAIPVNVVAPETVPEIRTSKRKRPDKESDKN